jgi:hypothetical protein
MAGTAFDFVDETRIVSRPRDSETELPRYPP